MAHTTVGTHNLNNSKYRKTTQEQLAYTKREGFYHRQYTWRTAHTTSHGTVGKIKLTHRMCATEDTNNKEMIGSQTTHETDDRKLTCRTDCIWNNQTTNE